MTKFSFWGGVTLVLHFQYKMIKMRCLCVDSTSLICKHHLRPCVERNPTGREESSLICPFNYSPETHTASVGHGLGQGNRECVTPGVLPVSPPVTDSHPAVHMWGDGGLRRPPVYPACWSSGWRSVHACSQWSASAAGQTAPPVFLQSDTGISKSIPFYLVFFFFYSRLQNLITMLTTPFCYII